MFEMPTEAEPVRVVHGDCLEVLRDMPDGCVDAVVTDPPYPCIKREYGYWTEPEWFALMNPVVEECRRVLKPTGSAVFVLQPNSERVGRMRTWVLEFTLKWAKAWGQVQDAYWWNHSTPPNKQCDRSVGLMRPSLKWCVWLGQSDCHRNQDVVLWDESQAAATERISQRARREYTPRGGIVDTKRWSGVSAERGGVTPFNVLPLSGHESNNHPGSTPTNLMRWWVRYICPPDGVVLDPFGGSGTTALATLAEGRRCILIEKESKYADICRRRVAEAMGKGEGSLLGILR